MRFSKGLGAMLPKTPTNGQAATSFLLDNM
jgi:hypothetical protein